MNRSQRCGVCSGCQAKPCGQCVYCQDSPQFGGPGVKKQSCLERRCHRVLENRLQRDAPTFKAKAGCNACDDCRSVPDCQVCLVCLDKKFFQNRYLPGAMCAKKRCNQSRTIELPASLYPAASSVLNGNGHHSAADAHAYQAMYSGVFDRNRMVAPVAHMNGIKRPPSGPESDQLKSKQSRPSAKAHPNGHVIESMPSAQQKAAAAGNMLQGMYSQMMPVNMMALSIEQQQQLHQQQLLQQQQQQQQQQQLQAVQRQQQQLLANAAAADQYNIQYLNGVVREPLSIPRPPQSAPQPEILKPVPTSAAPTTFATARGNGVIASTVITSSSSANTNGTHNNSQHSQQQQQHAQQQQAAQQQAAARQQQQQQQQQQDEAVYQQQSSASNTPHTTTNGEASNSAGNKTTANFDNASPPPSHEIKTPQPQMALMDQRYMASGFYPPHMMPAGNCSVASMSMYPWPTMGADHPNPHHHHHAYVDVDQLIPPSLSGKNVILQSL